MSLLLSGDLTLRKTWQPMDPDAAAYIAAVEAADTQALEEKTKIAIDNFVLGCKADGIWSAIKASCILAGARTLTGALIPLAGTAPTNFNFVSGDYNRKTGLVGDGSTKYLNSNRSHNADPQNNAHISVYLTKTSTSNIAIGAGSGSPLSVSQLVFTTQNDTLMNSAGATSGLTAQPAVNSLWGLSRNSATNFQARIGNGTYTSGTNASATTTANNYFVFARNLGGVVGSYSDPRLAFYSIGESLDLALLDARVTSLINAFAVAIP